MKQGADYITAEGYAALREEFDAIWKRKRPGVVRALAAAAAEGDRSENAEYIYRKKELREIDRRLKFLSGRIDAVRVVDRIPDDTSRVFFGAWVSVVDEDGDEATYRIVGADEVDTARGWISLRSPVAKALLGKGEGDAVRLRLPGLAASASRAARPPSETELEILAVRYSALT